MLLGRRGEVLLSDFGIALVAQSSRYQNTQDMAGRQPSQDAQTRWGREAAV